jgi:hypothetical protein
MFRFGNVIAAVVVSALVASVATFGSMALEAKGRFGSSRYGKIICLRSPLGGFSNSHILCAQPDI